MIPPYFALVIFVSFNSRVTSVTFLDITDQIVDLEEVCSPGVPTLYSFVSTMEFLKEGHRLHHDDLKQRNEDINVMDDLFEKSNYDQEESLEFRNQIFPLALPLKSRTRFLVVEENCNARIIRLQ